MISAFRFLARCIATPLFIMSFGFVWLGSVLLIGPLFSVFSFVAAEQFDWKEFLQDCNSMFCEPFIKMWGKEGKEVHTS